MMPIHRCSRETRTRMGQRNGRLRSSTRTSVKTITGGYIQIGCPPAIEGGEERCREALGSFLCYVVWGPRLSVGRIVPEHSMKSCRIVDSSHSLVTVDHRSQKEKGHRRSPRHL